MKKQSNCFKMTNYTYKNFKSRQDNKKLQNNQKKKKSILKKYDQKEFWIIKLLQ